MSGKKNTKKAISLKYLQFALFKAYQFNINLDDILREENINTTLSINGLRRNQATVVDNNCLLHSFFQLIKHTIEKDHSTLINQLGTLTNFTTYVRKSINKTKQEMLSINDEIEGLQIFTAVQVYFKNVKQLDLGFTLDLLLADNEGNIGQVDVSHLKHQISNGNIIIPLRIIYVNYDHYEPLFIKEEQPDLENKLENLDLSSNSYEVITAKELINKIKRLIRTVDKSNDNKQASLSEIKKELDSINYYFNQPMYVTGATFEGGLAKIHSDYEAHLLRIGLLINTKKKLSETEATTVLKGMKLLVQRYKVKRAYTDIYKGKKFTKAGLTKFNKKHPLYRKNPLQGLSKQNIKRLINELSISGNNTFGLQDDEIALFKMLLELPYKLQHATNSYYPILNSGSLDSYMEIKRRDTSFKSAYSTKGNVDKLGNDGFIFFRLFVEPINSSQTRYGDTSLLFNNQLLRRCGWISLHDQLKPFSTASAEHFYWNKRLIRTSEVTKIKNNTKDSNLDDGLLYHYRESEIQTYEGKKDTLKSFGDSIAASDITRSFLEEIFYAEDIILGIALSVIRELRHLEACGFRKTIIEYFKGTTNENRIMLLGELIKGFFRIEGKYPVSLQLQSNLSEKIQNFVPFAKTDFFQESDREYQVINPDGDGRYNINITLNPETMKLAEARAQRKIQEENLSILRRQRARFKSNENRKKEYDKEIDAISKALDTTNKFLESDKKRRTEIIEYFCENFDINSSTFDKIDTSKLELINEYFIEILEEDYATLKLLLILSNAQLRLIAQTGYYELILAEEVNFIDFAKLTLQELEILAQYDIAEAITEKNYTIDTLLGLYKENPIHLECVTCDDLTDLILDLAPEVDPFVMNYAKETDIEVDIPWIMEQLSESEQRIFRLNLGYDDEPMSEDEPGQEDYEEVNDEPNLEINNLMEDTFLDMMEIDLDNIKATEDDEIDETINELVNLSYFDKYNFAFEGITNRRYLFENFYNSYRFGLLKRQQNSVGIDNFCPLILDYKKEKQTYKNKYITSAGKKSIYDFFQPASFDKLLKNLKNNKIKKLDLLKQKIDSTIFIKLMEALINNTSVTEIDLEKAYITVSTDTKELPRDFFNSVFALTKALKNCMQLEKIFLWDCSLVTTHTDSTKFIVAAAKENPNIYNIGIDYVDYLNGHEIEDSVKEINARSKENNLSPS